MRTPPIDLVLLAALSAPCGSFGREIDRRCLQGHCVILSIENGRVLARRTGGTFTGQTVVGTFAPAGTRFVPPSEAPILHSTMRSGWHVTVSAYLPEEFDYDAPELRVRILAPLGRQETVSDEYNLLGSFHIGSIFNTDSQFLQVCTTGARAYFARSRVWLLGQSGSPELLLDVPGWLAGIETPREGKPAGLWIDRDTYDGVNAETKGHKREFWIWEEGRKTFSLAADR